MQRVKENNIQLVKVSDLFLERINLLFSGRKTYAGKSGVEPKEYKKGLKNPQIEATGPQGRSTRN